MPTNNNRKGPTGRISFWMNSAGLNSTIIDEAMYEDIQYLAANAEVGGKLFVFKVNNRPTEKHATHFLKYLTPKEVADSNAQYAKSKQKAQRPAESEGI